MTRLITALILAITAPIWVQAMQSDDVMWTAVLRVEQEDLADSICWFNGPEWRYERGPRYRDASCAEYQRVLHHAEASMNALGLPGHEVWRCWTADSCSLSVKEMRCDGHS